MTSCDNQVVAIVLDEGHSGYCELLSVWSTEDAANAELNRLIVHDFGPHPSDDAAPWKYMLQRVKMNTPSSHMDH